ncbi:MAG: hypothetical protein KGH84_05680 [Paracoccaceae bacterium]|nr:hypothetical protein [Paracoccaceae bacterium]
MARTLNYGCHEAAREGDLFAKIEAQTKANVRNVWTPNAANFFGRVSGGYLDALLADLLDADASDERVKTFAKDKKGEKAAILERLFADPVTQKIYGVTPEQAGRIAKWVPADLY